MTDANPGLRILVLVNGFPWPLTSGYLRHYHLIRELSARGHRISLVSIVSAGFSPEDRAHLEPFTERIVTVDFRIVGPDRCVDERSVGSARCRSARAPSVGSVMRS